MKSLVAVVGAFLLLQGTQDKIERLIRDLGADDYETREKADRELRKIGEAAVPALTKAAQDKDPERALRAKRILEHIRSNKKAPSRVTPGYRGLRFSTQDGVRGVKLDLYPDGRIEVTVREDDGSGRKIPKTYRAPSVEEFKRKYPDVYRNHGIEKLLPKVQFRFRQGDPFNKRLFKEFGLDRFEDLFKDFQTPFDDSFQKLLERQKKLLERLRRGLGPLEESPRGHNALGIRVGDVGDALRSHLRLKPGEGVLVSAVRPKSDAERCGLRKFDVLLKIDGTPIRGRTQFEREVRSREGKEFTLELLREGKPHTVKVTPEF